MDRPSRIIPIAAAAAAGDADAELFEVRQKIHPRAVTGKFAAWRWSMVWITQLVFYGLPWLTWNGRPAVLFDLTQRQFFLFGTVLYPQDFVYLTGLLVIAAMSLFLFTAVAGRLWCGYACPQTVYTEIFMWIEMRVEGDRAQRIRLDRAPMSARKLGLRAAKHGLWLAVALWTGVTFVGYFSGMRPLLASIGSLDAGGWEAFWVLFYAFATYGNAGFMREQVCKYMCPYARFQSAMIDRDTLVITYDGGRGDPRGSRSRKADPRALGLGDCVDCGVCVEVCPTGIDIRKGLQNECIGCAACVDACDKIMDRMGYARGLIRYDTERGVRERLSRSALLRQALRPRVLVYAAVLAAVTTGLVAHMALRTPLKVDVIRDRGVLGREVEDGMTENVYRLQVMNTSERARRLRIGVTGLESIAVVSNAFVDVERGEHRLVPVRVRALQGVGKPGPNRIEFTVEALDDTRVAVREKSTFFVPR
ncbi:MAG: cytochrome c oxidase accessory protein CcoG [Burkholderiaceae bacterium]